MNRILSRAGSLCLFLLSLCFAVPKPSSKAIAASGKVNITSYDCTYNSETGKYDCEVEGINSTDNYMHSLLLVAVDNFKSYSPLEDDNIFVDSLVMPGESFIMKYQAERNIEQDIAYFEPVFFGGTINEQMILEKDIEYKAHSISHNVAESEYWCYYDLQFNNDLVSKWSENGLQHIIYYSLRLFLNYDGVDYCVACEHYNKSNKIITAKLVYKEEIDTDKITISNALLYVVGDLTTKESSLYDGLGMTLLILGIMAATGIAIPIIAIPTFFIVRGIKRSRKKQ